MPRKKKPISDLYKELIAPQIQNNQEDVENLLELNNEDDSDIQDIIELLDGVEEKKITITKDGEVIDNDEFYSNLVEAFPSDVLDELYNTLDDYVKDDQEDRKPKDERYAKILKRLGASSEDTIGGASFQGASKVTHNAMFTALIDFCSRTIKEIAPVNGPVKSKIVGSASNDKIKLAEKKVKFYNYLLTEKVPYKKKLEILLSQLPLSGSAYLKWSYDKRRKVPVVEYVSLDHLYLPDYTQDFYTADRITHKLKYSKIQFKKLVRDGVYSLEHIAATGGAESDGDDGGYLDTGNSSVNNIVGEAERVYERIDGTVNSSDNEDSREQNLKILYEIHLDLELDDDPITKGVLAPYIVTIDAKENIVLSVYRNWEIGDEFYESKKWFVEFQFLPWGAYGIGFAELFDGTAGALTGALRALLDAGHVANFPTLIMLKGMGAAGQNVNVTPGQVMEIEGPTGVDQNIDKYMKQLQMGQPQPVLLDLMKNLENQFSTLFSATENISDQMSQSRDMPVGTTLALLDESSKRMSAIHARMHESNAVSFKILGRILKENITAVATIEEIDDAFIIKPSDFEFSNDIIPVSDPNIYSNSQRFAQLQAVFQLAQQAPNEFNIKELTRRMLQLIEVPDPEGLLNITQDAGNINAVAENSAVLNGIPIQVFSMQSHMGHFVCHLEFLESSVYGNPVFLASGGQVLVQHMQKHLTELYNQVFNEFVVQNGGNQLDLSTSEAQVDAQLAKYNPMVLKVIDRMLQPYQERIQKVMQAVEKAQPPQPQDPKLQETQMKIQAEQQLEQMRIEAQQNQMQEEMQVKKEELQMKYQVEQMMMQNQAQNDASELEIARISSESDREIARSKSEDEKVAMGVDIIKVGADLYEKDMEIQRDLALNEHTQNMDQVKHGFDVMSKGAELHLEHVKLNEMKEAKKASAKPVQ